MKKPRSSAGRTTAKTDQQNEILNRLFDYFSKPKGEKTTSDNDIDVSFYSSTLNALPRNFHYNNYNGVNIIMRLQAQEESATKVPIYSTFKQAAALAVRTTVFRRELFLSDKVLQMATYCAFMNT
ncbi:hypothetical protein Xvie_00001 [Xenorhabdus vietnamensis]|uniref:Uncharacterized protein n=1 Tax=Xenorhabdus vietnamensis TaxID=351656 RepID=A0A1Y2SH82_9GAMM|nr:ssDNA-binding domain-containing protein [Xenorhabdus vietnamensis]OTA18190.1 hypothetical protein Xvie_00001 [Xenorhabdus vietnamensis]